MAVRDLLWGCPICLQPGTLRPHGRHERCRACGAQFRRGKGAFIIVEHAGSRLERPASEWLALLGPVTSSSAGSDGVILGPESVRIRLTRRQQPLHFAGHLLGWVEVYDRPRRGTLILTVDGLHFRPGKGTPEHWSVGDLTGLQPASSSLQLGLHRHMASVKFLEGSVRLWTKALSDLLRDYHHDLGRDVVELQPFLRTCRSSTPP